MRLSLFAVLCLFITNLFAQNQQESIRPLTPWGENTTPKQDIVVYEYNGRVYTPEQLRQLRPAISTNKGDRWVTNFKSFHLNSAANSCPSSLALAGSWSTPTGFCQLRAANPAVCPTYYAAGSSWNGTIHFAQCADYLSLPTPVTIGTTTYTHGTMYACSIECL